jgi:hypothetical protein
MGSGELVISAEVEPAASGSIGEPRERFWPIMKGLRVGELLAQADAGRQRCNRHNQLLAEWSDQ